MNLLRYGASARWLSAIAVARQNPKLPQAGFSRICAMRARYRIAKLKSLGESAV